MAKKANEVVSEVINMALEARAQVHAKRWRNDCDTAVPASFDCLNASTYNDDSDDDDDDDDDDVKSQQK